MSDEVSREVKGKSKKSRTGSLDVVYLRRAHGDEPSWENVKITDFDYDMRILQAYNWANASFDSATLKKITVEYLADNEEYLFAKDMPDYYFISVGKQAWLRMNKAPTTPESDAFFVETLDNLKARYKKIKEDELIEKEIILDISAKLSAEQTAKLEYVGLYSFLDHLITIDNLDGDKVYDIIRSKSPSQLALRNLVEHYKNNVSECDECANSIKLKGKEKKYIQSLRSGSYTIVNVVDKILSNVRAENKLNKISKPRKKKVKPAQMQVKNLKFKESDSSLKLVSIPPTAIIAAPSLVTFNTDTRKVAIYYAKNTDGLSVKGTTIQNFDPEKSKTKILRKPEELIEHLIGTSAHRFEKVFAGIKSKQNQPNGRINEDTLLLKVFKI